MMRKNSIGLVCAGLMVAGVAVAVTPGVASAAGFDNYNITKVDAAGGAQQLDSQYGNQVKVDVAVDFATRPTCKLSVSPDGDDSARPVYTATFALKKTDGIYSGTKTTRALKPGYYYALTTCTARDETPTPQFTPFQIVDAPPLVISGTTTCYQGNQEGGKPEFIRPVGLDLADEDSINPVRLIPTTIDGRKASKFTYKSYGAGPFTAKIKCGGTARNPGRVFTFPEPVTAPSSGISLVAD